jgi:cytochrome b
MPSSKQILVWDGYVRFFHWALVSSYVAAYVTSQIGVQNAHTYIGYFITVIVGVRLLWGIIGSRYARFSSFVYSPSEIFAYLRQAFGGRPPHYVGHNPAGSVMVYILLLLLTAVIASGFITLATIEFEGPLVTLLGGVSDETVYLVQDVHRLLINAGWVLVGLHVTGVVVASIQHRENLVRSMVTGRKPVADGVSNSC